MKSNHITYDFEKSRQRIDDILKTADKSFEEVNSIPSRDKLTFNNGFYINNTSALFVDIRQSSKLPSKYQRPVLARIYRSYISEVVAVINGNPLCAEVNINGDCVWGIFDASTKPKIDDVFATAAQISSIVHVLNCKFIKKNIEPIRIGIGIAFGRVLMIKAGYSGSNLNDVLWMGDVVNESSNLCFQANKGWNKRLMVSNIIRNNLNKTYQGFLEPNPTNYCYHCDVIVKPMENWIEQNN